VIYLLRHGETIWNRAGRAQGRSDSPLTWRGIGQARAYAECLMREIPDPRSAGLHVSPLFRAWQTAAIVADHLGVSADDLRTSPLLAELDCGDWEGLTSPEMEQRDPAHFAARRDDPWGTGPPGGESRAQVHERARRWLAEEARMPVSIVVAHGIVSRVLRGAYLGLEPAAILQLQSHRHGVLFRLDRGRIDRLDAGERVGQTG